MRNRRGSVRFQLYRVECAFYTLHVGAQEKNLNGAARAGFVWMVAQKLPSVEHPSLDEKSVYRTCNSESNDEPRARAGRCASRWIIFACLARRPLMSALAFPTCFLHNSRYGARWFPTRC